MNYSTPEQQGIHSSDIHEYIKHLERFHLSTHSLLIARHGSIVSEYYWKPFHRDFLHRQYSVSKSFVALAVGFAEQDGLLHLDDPLVRYFPKEAEHQRDENMKRQTIRQTLMMSTAKIPQNWFAVRTDDRVGFYFQNNDAVSRPAGTIFQYDSTGSFILCALVERLTGKTLVQYLKEKLFDKIGVSDRIDCLECPGGHSWGDSGLLCSSLDLLKVAMFCMNKGMWNGEQILNEAYITAAVSKQIDNNPHGTENYCEQGYGYLIWRCFDNSFFFNGMGCQFAICVPDKELILIYNGDNQGNTEAKTLIINTFFDRIARRCADEPLPDDKAAYSALKEKTEGLELFSVKGQTDSPFQEKINGTTFLLDENPMKISKLKLCFSGDEGVLYYTNEQGDKELPFGIGRNRFSQFPQMGYSDRIGSQPGNRLYRCAVSAAWTSEYQLNLRVQIIDTYFGNLAIQIGFRDDGTIGVHMVKTAEDFLNEYNGYATGKQQ